MMALRAKRNPVGLFGTRLGGPTREAEFQRLEDTYRSLSEITQKWHLVLREMERTGQSSDARYGRYCQAYSEARQIEKRAELELFNLRQGLID